jgi:hypothetical protein
MLDKVQTVNDSQCSFLFRYSLIDIALKPKSAANNLQFLYWKLHKTESYDKQKPGLDVFLFNKVPVPNKQQKKY